ncbi:hypothetical protein BJX99DRAFT_253169 [Aspergillus californicus]
MIYLPSSVPVPLPASISDLLRLSEAVGKCRASITEWFDWVGVGLESTANLPGCTSFVALYIDLVWIYYFAGQIALSHFVIYRFSTAPILQSEWLVHLNVSKNDLKEAFIGLKTVFRRLSRSDLVGYLPISASAYTAMPLLLVSLVARLSPSQSQREKSMQDVSHCTVAMRQYEHRFTSAKFVSELVCKVLRQTDCIRQLRPMASDTGDNASDANSSPTASWTDAFSRNPQLYFKLLFSLDYSLSLGKLPSLQELPDILPVRFPSLSSPGVWQPVQLAQSDGIPYSMSSTSRRVEPGSDPSSEWAFENELPSSLSISGDSGALLGLEYAQSILEGHQNLLQPSPWGLEILQDGIDGQGGDMDSDFAFRRLSSLLQYSCPAIG